MGLQCALLAWNTRLQVTKAPVWSLTHIFMGRRVVRCGALESVGPGPGVTRKFGGDGNVPYLDLSDGYMSVYIYQNSSNCTLKTCVLYHM